MKKPDGRILRRVLSSAARKAGVRLIALQDELLRRDKPSQRCVVHRHGVDITTSADTQAEEIVIDLLRREFPDIPIVSEEGNHEIPQSGRFFVVDALDGTMIFYNGCDDFGVTIAYLENHAPQYGVLYLPRRNILVFAERGEGCTVNGRAIMVRTPRRLNEEIVGIEAGVHARKEILNHVVRPIAVACRYPRILGTAVGSMTALLQGHIAAYVNCEGPKIWDFAAGVLALQEAGGSACAPDGKPLEWRAIPMAAVCANSKALGDEIIPLLGKWSARKKTR